MYVFCVSFFMPRNRFGLGRLIVVPTGGKQLLFLMSLPHLAACTTVSCTGFTEIMRSLGYPRLISVRGDSVHPSSAYCSQCASGRKAAVKRAPRGCR